MGSRVWGLELWGLGPKPWTRRAGTQCANAHTCVRAHVCLPAYLSDAQRCLVIRPPPLFQIHPPPPLSRIHPPCHPTHPHPSSHPLRISVHAAFSGAKCLPLFLFISSFAPCFPPPASSLSGPPLCPSSPFSHALLLTLCLPRVLFQKRWLGRVWPCPPTEAGVGERE